MQLRDAIIEFDAINFIVAWLGESKTQIIISTLMSLGVFYLLKHRELKTQ